MKRPVDLRARDIEASRLSMGQRVREIRKARGWTLADLATRAGLAVSTISKVERGALSPTYDRFSMLARGLGMDIGELFSPQADPFHAGSVNLTRRGQARRHETPTYIYDMHAADLAGKRMTPMSGRIKAHDRADFDQLLSHPGEEFLYLLSGQLHVHLHGSEPVTLEAGDSLYFDSALGHAYVSAGPQDAEILVVCWSPDRFKRGYPLPPKRKRGAKLA